jgi:hypothetical protein
VKREHEERTRKVADEHEYGAESGRSRLVLGGTTSMMLDNPIRPQPSERWAMYRLICPVVDKACDVSALEPYFEYSQPNGPNRRLFADIALMR